MSRQDDCRAWTMSDAGCRMPAPSGARTSGIRYPASAGRTDARGRAPSRAGFTLLELLVVVIIIVLLAGAAVAMYGNFMRGQGARQGAMIMIQTVARTKQFSADQRVMHFIVFSNVAEGGQLMIHRDANSNGLYEAGTDLPVETNAIELPKFCDFEVAPQWMGFNPSGYVVYSPNALTGGAFAEVQAGTFDGAMAASTPTPKGDIIVRMRNEPYRVCMDVDRAAGKIRRHQFLAQ